jgi:hypothetical protein
MDLKLSAQAWKNDTLWKTLNVCYSVPDPGSRIPDPGSQTHIFVSLVTNFYVKSSTIL